jgi:hypothetical protein
VARAFEADVAVKLAPEAASAVMRAETALAG